MNKNSVDFLSETLWQLFSPILINRSIYRLAISVNKPLNSSFFIIIEILSKNSFDAFWLGSFNQPNTSKIYSFLQ